MACKTAADRVYLELTTRLIARATAEPKRGEQPAFVSFTNVAKLAGHASEELTGSDPRARVRRLNSGRRANLQGCSLQAGP
jgi:hypothetical protein